MKYYSKMLLSLSLSLISFSCSIPNTSVSDNIFDSVSKTDSNFNSKYLPSTTDGYNEDAYLIAFSDIANIIKNPNNPYLLKSGYQHFVNVGRN